MNKYVYLIILMVISVSSVAAQNVGINTTSPLAKLHVDLGTSISNGILFTGGEPAGGNFPSLGAGNRMMYYPGRGVFRAGYVEDTQWDNSNVGAFSFGFGFNTIAKGNGSFATGDGTYAGGTISSAFGNSTISKGYSSFVLGMYNDPLIVGADQDFALPTTPLFIVGNGDGNETDLRRNAMIIRKDGHVGVGTNTPNNQLSVFGTVDISGNTVIGETSIHESAQLAVSSTTKGFLPPRMTWAQRFNIANPETGLVIYCKDCGVHGQLQVYNGQQWENMMGTPGEPVPYVGAVVPGGGVVFYIFQPGDPGYIAGETHGLYAGLNIQDYDWGCMGVEVPGADGTALGTGPQNTIDIQNECSFPNAAWVCFIKDGYLPSKDEMNLLVSSGVVDQFDHCEAPNWHCLWWTSSEINADSAWVYDFQTNTLVAGQKDNALGNIIPIYSF